MLIRVVREPNALLGVLVALLGLLVLFGVPLTRDQVGGLVTFLGALMVLARQLVVPASEVVAQRKRGKRTAVAGPAAAVATGLAVDVTVASRPEPGTPAGPVRGEAGESVFTVGWFMVAVLFLIAVGLLLLR